MAFDDDDDFDDRPRRRRDDDEEEDDDRRGRRGRRRYENDRGEYDFQKRDEPHSGLGIASLAIAVFAGVALLVIFAVAGEMVEDGGGFDEESPAAIALVALAIGACALTMLGIGLGVGGVVQRDRNKRVAVAGLIANALVLVGSAALMCLGALMD
jgi:hypothetical protein